MSPGDGRSYDPPLAVGFEYEMLEGPNVIVVIPPVLGDNTYILRRFDGVPDTTITGGVPYVLEPEGVTRFQILGIEPSDGVDATDPTAFVTEIFTTETGIGWFKMTPIVASDSGPLTVSIAIKPGSDLAPVNPTSNGVVAVAILATSEFDINTVNLATIRFGRTGTEASSAAPKLEDTNSDGQPDLLFHFPTPTTGVVCGDTSAALTGKTTAGQDFGGSNPIKTVGCK